MQDEGAGPDEGAAALARLREAKATLERYAGRDSEKKLFADEVDDIMRRVAAEIESAKRA